MTDKVSVCLYQGCMQSISCGLSCLEGLLNTVPVQGCLPMYTTSKSQLHPASKIQEAAALNVVMMCARQSCISVQLPARMNEEAAPAGTRDHVQCGQPWCAAAELLR
jgi:hypothetical protein